MEHTLFVAFHVANKNTKGLALADTYLPQERVIKHKSKVIFRI